MVKILWAIADTLFFLGLIIAQVAIFAIALKQMHTVTGVEKAIYLVVATMIVNHHINHSIRRSKEREKDVE